MKKIFFIVENRATGSSQMRGQQISDELGVCGVESQVITHNELDSIGPEPVILIWIKNIIDKIKQLPNCHTNIYDFVDKLALGSVNSLSENIEYLDALIVNSNEMKSSLEYQLPIFVIPHHWDPRIAQLRLVNQEILKFGYLGSLSSLRTTANFIHHGALALKYNISFIDSDTGENFTNKIKSGNYPAGESIVDGFTQSVIDFNCHLSIRDANSDLFRYKTTAKVVTAAALGHNIITTYDHAFRDILSENYPYLLRTTDYREVVNMIEKVKYDYENDKNEWNTGLEIMKTIKNSLSIKTVIDDYVKLSESFIDS